MSDLSEPAPEPAFTEPTAPSPSEDLPLELNTAMVVFPNEVVPVLWEAA